MIDDTDVFDTFLQIHKPQLQSSGVPERFWESLFRKLRDQIFDAGLVFQLMKVEYEDDTDTHVTKPIWKLYVSVENGIHSQELNNIYLIDHAWMYDVNHAQQNLSQIPGLLDRMYSLMNRDSNTVNERERIKYVMKEMWRYNQSFSLNSETIEDRMPIWYIMDEVGTAINHSDKPNFRTVPFLYISEGTTYTLLFPMKDVAKGHEVTRDFVEGQTNESQKRRALLLPWIHSSFDNESFEHIEPDLNYFSMGYIHESLPQTTDMVTIDKSKKLKVFSEYSNVNSYLTDPTFEITDNKNEADILWLTSHYKTYKELSISTPNVFINQFPHENLLTTKDLLSIVCRRKATGKLYDPDTLETYPVWLPTTYNLNTELVQFVAYFTQRANKDLGNHWICKPWNLARALDTHITDDLYHILRLPSTGPKIAQKYIAHPVLYNRTGIGKVKFDIRYVILFKSVIPLRTYAYANFFLRFANLPFALNNFDVYEQHFTVMNYSEESSLYHVKCAEFILEWENQYPNYPWKTYVEPKILSIFQQVFEAVISQSPPRGIPESPQSRAIYAADLILEWKDSEMQPKLLEMNFTPDCQRACEYYPDFYNDIFKCLFLDLENPDKFHVLNC